MSLSEWSALDRRTELVVLRKFAFLLFELWIADAFRNGVKIIFVLVHVNPSICDEESRQLALHFFSRLTLFFDQLTLKLLLWLLMTASLEHYTVVWTFYDVCAVPSIVTWRRSCWFAHGTLYNSCCYIGFHGLPCAMSHLCLSTAPPPQPLARCSAWCALYTNVTAWSGLLNTGHWTRLSNIKQQLTLLLNRNINYILSFYKFIRIACFLLHLTGFTHCP